MNIYFLMAVNTTEWKWNSGEPSMEFTIWLLELKEGTMKTFEQEGIISYDVEYDSAKRSRVEGENEMWK